MKTSVSKKEEVTSSKNDNDTTSKKEEDTESKKEDMKLVKDLLVDTVKSAKAKTIVPPIIVKGMEK